MLNSFDCSSEVAHLLVRDLRFAQHTRILGGLERNRLSQRDEVLTDFAVNAAPIGSLVLEAAAKWSGSQK